MNSDHHVNVQLYLKNTPVMYPELHLHAGPGMQTNLCYNILYVTKL